MMFDDTVSATLCKSRHGEPLALVDMPGGDAGLTPAELRALAAVLLQIAVDAEAQPLKHKHYRPTKKAYQLAT